MPTPRNSSLNWPCALLVWVGSLGCRQPAQPPADPTGPLTIALKQAQGAMAERDTLLRDVLETTRFINAISDDLTTVRSLRPGKSVVIAGELGRISAASYRATLLARIQDLATRVNGSEARLQQSRTRVAGRAGADPQLMAQLADYGKMIEEFKTTIDRQRVEIGSLATQVRTLKVDNERLASAHAAASDSLAGVLEEQNTAYYLAGTKEQLLELGVIVEVGGGGGFLGIGKRPKTFAPARELHPSDFKAINKWQDLEIVLPRPERQYRILSRQNTAYLAVPPDRDARVRSRLRISDADQFWAPSGFLILLEEK